MNTAASWRVKVLSGQNCVVLQPDVIPSSDIFWINANPEALAGTSLNVEVVGYVKLSPNTALSLPRNRKIAACPLVTGALRQNVPVVQPEAIPRSRIFWI